MGSATSALGEEGRRGHRMWQNTKTSKGQEKYLPSACSSLFSLDCYVTLCFGGSIQMACATLLMQLVVRMSHRRLKC